MPFTACVLLERITGILNRLTREKVSARDAGGTENLRPSSASGAAIHAWTNPTPLVLVYDALL